MSSPKDYQKKTLLLQSVAAHFLMVNWSFTIPEPVSKKPEKDDQAGQMDEFTKQFKAEVPPGDDSSDLTELGEEPFDRLVKR